VAEEVGLTVKNPCYFASQSWPFPHSLMIAFSADYAGGEIRIDGEEIVAADWFTPENLPQLPGNISIARRLIDDFLTLYSKSPLPPGGLG
jgi:NAD+ diphosphatase